MLKQDRSDIAMLVANNGNKLSWSHLHIDWSLCCGLIICFMLGMLILYSANLDFLLIKKQAIRIGLAFLLMFMVAQIPPRVFLDWALFFYIFSLVMLISVLLIGDIGKGAQRWLNLGVIKFQPSELMKLAVPMMVARSLQDHVLPPKTSALILPVLYIMVPATLIAMQPDLGTALLIVASGAWCIFFAGISWKLIVKIFALGVVSAPLLWMCLRDYQKQRILTLLNPERDPLGTGYHIIQSKIAIGSGGLYGKGWLHGTQSHLEFLPERTTDFIFSVFGEEFGFFGVIMLLIAYSFIVVRGLYIGVQAQNTFGRLLSSTIIMTFFIYVFVNIGMVSGILPVVGIPLPLISYGGTALVTLMIGFGIVMSVHTHRMLLGK